jgi:hypothetical protein
MSLFKYFNELGGPGSTHQGSLQWPRSGDLNLPLRHTNQIALTEAEVEAVEPILDFHCRKFDLWVPEELAEYMNIRDRCENTWYQIVFVERKFDPEHKHWTIYMEWTQLYGEIPNGKVPIDLRAPVAPAAIELAQSR